MILGKTWRVDGGPHLVYDLPERALKGCGRCGWIERGPALTAPCPPDHSPPAGSTRPGRLGSHQEAGTGKRSCALLQAGSLEREAAVRGRGSQGPLSATAGPGQRHEHTSSCCAWLLVSSATTGQGRGMGSGDQILAWTEGQGPSKRPEPTQIQERLAPFGHPVPVR